MVDVNEKYKSDWPNHCTVCRGWSGIFSSYDPSPAGVALSPGNMMDFDSCEECYDKRVCCRCAAPLGEKDDEKCPSCGCVFGETEGLMDDCDDYGPEDL